MSNSPKIPGFEQANQFEGSFKYTPLEWLRGLFVGFLQGLFGAAPIGSYHWEEDRQTTDIVIQDEAPVSEETMQQRPLIVITRGPIQFYSFGMDDLHEYRMDINRKTKGILVPGTITINCCSRTPLEAENIAWTVGEHLWLLRDLLIGTGRLFDVGRQIQIGAPSPAGSIIADDNGHKWYAVAVSVPFQFTRTSARTPLGDRIIQNIHARLSPRFGGKPAQGGPPPVGGHEYPVDITRYPPPPIVNAPDAKGATASFAQQGAAIQKQRHPLYPDKEVTIRTVRPYRPGLHSNAPPAACSIPIRRPHMEQFSNK
jgi:hypothetical protein